MIACLVASLALQGQSVTLLYRPPVNKVYKFRMVTDTKMDMGAMGSNSFKMTMDSQQKILSRKGDLTTIENKILDFKMAAPPGSPMAGAMANSTKGAIGKTTTMVMDSHYKPRSVAGIGPQASKMMGSFQNFSFPSKPIRVGESWTSPMDLGKITGAMGSGPAAGMKVDGNVPIVCKLLSTDGKTAKISMTMKGTLNMAMGAQKIKTLMDGGGTFVVDVATGVTRSASFSMDTTTNFGSQSMKQHMSQTMSPL